MGINFELLEEEVKNQPVIKVIGVGGAGGNAVGHMISQQLSGVEFIIANTDATDLEKIPAPIKIQLGKKLTEGKGAGGDPKIGRQAAEESEKEIEGILKGADMVFITAGMGGGTGTGAAPVIAKICKEMGILTVGVVTKPFSFELRRIKIAEEGIEELSKYVDALIVISNDKILTLAGPDANFYDGLKKADDVLYYAVKGISDVILCPGYINLDFADVKAVLSDSGGLALMGMGEATGENRAEEALRMAISNPLLEDLSIKGAKRILVNITADKSSFTMKEMQLINSLVGKEVDPEAMVYHGIVFNEGLGDLLRVTVIATGLEACSTQEEVPETDAEGEGKVMDLTKKLKEVSIEEKLKKFEEFTEDIIESCPAFLRRKAN